MWEPGGKNLRLPIRCSYSILNTTGSGHFSVVISFPITIQTNPKAIKVEGFEMNKSLKLYKDDLLGKDSVRQNQVPYSASSHIIVDRRYLRSCIPSIALFRKKARIVFESGSSGKMKKPESSGSWCIASTLPMNSSPSLNRTIIFFP